MLEIFGTYEKQRACIELFVFPPLKVFIGGSKTSETGGGRTPKVGSQLIIWPKCSRNYRGGSQCQC